MSATPTICVVGLGAMGLGIAQVFAVAGNPVIATDCLSGARDTAKARMVENLNQRVESGKLTAAMRDATMARFHVADDVSAFAAAALVVEAVVENLEIKQQLFSALEICVSSDCVLATNTSSLPVSAIMARLHHKERALGLHFFNPVQAMKLVELVAPSDTTAAAIEIARSLATAAGKTVIACRDTPGFVVNRCARPFYGEALALLEEGRNPSDIDAAMQLAGYRLGPFGLIDLVGADINLAATENLFRATGQNPRYHVFASLKKQVASGQLGRKSGRGFLFPEKIGNPPDDAEAIAERIEVTLANEAASLLGESELTTGDIDTALKLGLNFPRGPFEFLRRYGVAKAIAQLDKLEVAAPPHLKGRYRVAPVLEKIA